MFKKILSYTKKYGIGAASAVAVLGVLYYEKQVKHTDIAYTSWTNNFEPSVKWISNWDSRDPESLLQAPKSGEIDKNTDDYKNLIKTKTPTASRHLVLIRHGHYNTDGLMDLERNLTKLGREQADITGQRLKALNKPYTELISSTMTRAMETAEIIHQYFPLLDIERNDLLREGAPIPPEPPVGHWKPEFYFYRDGPRIEAAFRKYFHRANPEQQEDSHQIIVCHANVIRYFVCRALQFPPEAWLRLSLAHASLTFVTIRPSGRVSIRGLGDIGHMPVEKLSYS
ncbi:serine/threonine-protein phosphatase PGAM5, mitochondrial-like isoform X2 [Gigantopelta aegis]|uniref:serine/threonine-protein phosphatase PGAM5, mitochondrial-like isoform X2 n=1 Tax=Gigantopelta aegis TaxID=1735272 RepID=UPI001B88E6FA|nr:serine/threonine-protein phosphatase PGAM5, mitochondrial-like isoform X2 [Gigantopelta aegis]